MKLRQVTMNPQGFTSVCVGCLDVMRGHDPRWADLDGEPFASYYCPKCAKKSIDVKSDKV